MMAGDNLLLIVLLSCLLCLTTAATVFDCSTYCDMAKNVEEEGFSLEMVPPIGCKCVQGEYHDENGSGDYLSSCEYYCDVSQQIYPDSPELERPLLCSCSKNEVLIFDAKSVTTPAPVVDCSTYCEIKTMYSREGVTLILNSPEECECEDENYTENGSGDYLSSCEYYCDVRQNKYPDRPGLERPFLCSCKRNCWDACTVNLPIVPHAKLSSAVKRKTCFCNLTLLAFVGSNKEFENVLALISREATCTDYCEVKRVTPTFINRDYIRPKGCNCKHYYIRTCPLECPQWFDLDAQSCSCEPSICPIGYRRIGDICEACYTRCPSWYYLDAHGCECIPMKCPSNYARVDDSCNYCNRDCPPGFYLDRRCDCTPDLCPSGSVLVGDRCEVANCDIKCPDGTYFDNITCECYQNPCPYGFQFQDNKCTPCESKACPEGQEYYQQRCVCRICSERNNKPCSEGLSYDTNVCACVECEKLDCPAGEQFLPNECRCYPCEPIECNYGYVYSRDECRCVRGCKPKVCPNEYVFESSNCECYHKCDRNRCPFGKIFIPETCSCVQGDSLTDICPWDHWKNVLTQKCEPCNPSDCSLFDDDYVSSFMFMDYETCTCVKSYCQPSVCRENMIFDPSLCICISKCSGKNTLCPFGQTFDDKTCSCVGKCTPTTCGFGQYFDSDICICRLIPCEVTECNTAVGEYFDQNECRCKQSCKRYRCLTGQTWHSRLCGCRRCSWAEQPCLLSTQKWKRKTCSCEDCIHVPLWLCPLAKSPTSGLVPCNCRPDTGDYNFNPWFAASSSSW